MTMPLTSNTVGPTSFIAKFFECYEAKCQQIGQRISEEWGSNCRWTILMRGASWEARNDCVLGNLARALQLSCFREYWGLDFVLFRELEELPDHYKGDWVKSLSVIIEHENDIESAWQEVNKLGLWNAELRVLITYANQESDIEPYVKLWNDILRTKRVSSNGFLALIGRFPKNAAPMPTSADWNSCVWDGSRLLPIENEV